MRKHSSNATALGGIALIVALLALALSGVALTRGTAEPAGRPTQAVPGLLERIDAMGELHAGYGVYPPYSLEDPNTQNVSGYSVDIVERIAGALNVPVVWHRINWDTMSADLKRGEFDVIADPIFQTISRAPEFAFSEPYAYFPDGIAVVRINENRFDNFESLDQQGVKINVGLGQASEALVRAHFTNAEIIPIPAGTDNMKIFQDVLAGRSDVAVADLPNAKRFVDEHATRLKALWMEAPPAYMPAGFALRPSDTRGADFLTICIRYLGSTGILDDIRKEYDLPSVERLRN
jgi:ABC-type amino acid transport substrate-binding protein